MILALPILAVTIARIIWSIVGLLVLFASLSLVVLPLTCLER